MKDSINQILKLITNNLNSLNGFDSFVTLLYQFKDKNVFLTGAGRSGFVARSFAMRLMHLGYSVYVVGETTTPPIKSDDLLIAVSGSGSTPHICYAAETAKSIGATIVAITSSPSSRLGGLADYVVKVGNSKPILRNEYVSDQLVGAHSSLAPMGTVFELSSQIMFDAIISELMNRLNVEENYMKSLHANIQ